MSGTKQRPTRVERNLRKHLKELVAAVEAHIRALDDEMAKPSDVERGKRVARLANALEMMKDQAKFYGLGMDFRTGRPRQMSHNEVKRERREAT